MAEPKVARERAEWLRAELTRHERLYYNEAKPEISDAEYDALFRELEAIEAEHQELVSPDSPTQRVGAPLPEGESFEKVEHEVPMLSIESLFGEEEVREFEEKLLRFIGEEEGDELEWVVEPKFDGVSASLIYEDGVFVRGVTRGDGRIGEDVTQNLRTVRNLPLSLDTSGGDLPKVLEVRGEVLIQLERFHAFNEAREAAGQDRLANPRNAAAGALRRNDPSAVAEYPLEFHTWSAPRFRDEEYASQTEANKALKRWGLPFSGYGEVVKGLDSCIAYHAKMEAGRDDIPFEIDGVVAKLDDLALRERLGRTARAMRWQYAHKFTAREVSTTLLAIEASVGTNGRLTPRAHVQAVEVGGVVVRHTTLHNAEHLASLGVKVGDRVFVHRAGDVIPQINGVAKAASGAAPADWDELLPEELRAEGGGAISGVTRGWAEEYAVPATCPACGTVPVQEGKYWRCPNTYGCPPQVVGRTTHLAGRGGFEIDRIGPKQIAQLIEAGLIHGPGDLFHLDREEGIRAALVALDRWGEKSVDGLFEELRERRRIDFGRFLAALAIPDVGAQTGRLLALHFDNLDALKAACEEELLEVDGIGPEVAASIAEWFRSEEGVALLERLFSGGVELVYPEESAGGGALDGKTLVFTGTMEGMTRAEAKQQAEAAGGRVASSVSKKTDYLVVGGKPGSKAKKAEELGVEVLLEADFVEFLRSDG
ncbi:MAG: NAD-dependent DNA ligase LigA [Planctomycetes bacterium]|nr:NAD-dependent DNA ligase LigA [Planctomycetota bacterium]